MYLTYVTNKSSEVNCSLQRRSFSVCVERVQALVDQGRLLVAGPMPNIDSPDPGPAGFSGSTIIAEFDSLEDARQWAGADPYVEAGIYEYVDVRPFIRALP